MPTDANPMKRCVVHNNNAGPKDRHCAGWWWANGGDPKAGLAQPCEFEPEAAHIDGPGPISEEGRSDG